MTEKFTREKDLAERLLDRLGLDADGYGDPNDRGAETGADVLVVLRGRRVGIQVTVLDTGAVPGMAIAAEKRTANTAQAAHGGVYSMWGQNQPIAPIAASIGKKVEKSRRYSFAGFDEVWLLVSCGVPERGAVVSTFLMSPWVTAAALQEATGRLLAGSAYARAFLHPIIGLEEALYRWAPAIGWEKLVKPAVLSRGPSFWDIQNVMRKFSPLR